MPQLGIRFGSKTMTWDEARVASAAGQIPYPPPLIEEMAEQRDSQTPTASTLAGCLRRFELQRTTGYYEAPNKALASIFGTAFHAQMDKRRTALLQPGEHAEMRMSAEVKLPFEEPPHGYFKTVTLSGQVDFLREGDIISDWKTKKYIPASFTPSQDHKAQVNVYNWLAAQNGLTPAVTGELVYVSQDWIQRETFPLRPTEFVGKWIANKLREWVEPVAAGKLPAPVPAFYQQDAATGKLPAPCVYCPVIEACRAAFAAEGEAPWIG